MSATSIGRRSWSVTRDKEGHREYKLKLRIVSAYDDGPYTILSASGAPAIGAQWTYGNDNDPWALCWPNCTVTPVIVNEPNRHWDVDYLFSTKPFSRCQDNSIEDPLLEPMKISGSFVKYTKLTNKDREGNLILSSSHEPIPVEKDANRPSVVIEQNVPYLGLETFSQMIDTVNDAALWGLEPRCIKLSNAPWSRQVYGTCSYYFTRRFEFDVRYETFDESEIADVGTMCLKREWRDGVLVLLGGNANNPNDFIRIKDARGENCPPMMLDGAGNVNDDPIGDPKFLETKELYGESNFLTLGVPSSLG